jgi:hypothetical protein
VNKALLSLRNYEEFSDLCEWMLRDGAAEFFDDPYMFTEAAQWLVALDPEVFPLMVFLPHPFVDAIEYAIEDWCEVLASYEDSDPFHSEVIR